MSGLGLGVSVHHMDLAAQGRAVVNIEPGVGLRVLGFRFKCAGCRVEGSGCRV